jgi:hypothetical protein
LGHLRWRFSASQHWLLLINLRLSTLKRTCFQFILGLGTVRLGHVLLVFELGPIQITPFLILAFRSIKWAFYEQPL